MCSLLLQAKASGKKLQRVSLAVSLRGIRMRDLTTDEDKLQVSIYRFDAVFFAISLVHILYISILHSPFDPKKKFFLIFISQR